MSGINVCLWISYGYWDTCAHIVYVRTHCVDNIGSKQTESVYYQYLMHVCQSAYDDVTH